MKRLFLLSTLLWGMTNFLQARPLITEEVPTNGKYAFEARFGLSSRSDKFGEPEFTYETVRFPVRASVGLTEIFDLGFELAYTTHRIKTQSADFKGSLNGRFSPYVKLSPWKYLGFQLFYHSKTPEKGEDNLPLANGDGVEALVLTKLPTAWPISFNAGYIVKGKYRTKLGVNNGPSYSVEPGNIYEGKAAMEIPIKYHFALLSELAYYSFEKTKILGSDIAGSNGEALDALVGLTWGFRGWNIGAGASFGVLEEEHTSFDVEHGAGDVQYRVSISYKLVPLRRDR